MSQFIDFSNTTNNGITKLNAVLCTHYSNCFWLFSGYNWLFYFLRPYILLLKIIFGVFLLQDFCCYWLDQKDSCLYNEVWSRDRTQFERRSSTHRGQLRNTPPHHKQLILYIIRGVQMAKNTNIAISSFTLPGEKQTKSSHY